MRKYDILAKEEKELIKLINNDIDSSMNDCYNNEDTTEKLKGALKRIISVADNMIKICDK